MWQPRVFSGLAEYGYPRFTPDDLEALAAEAGLPLQAGVDRAALARQLESASDFFIGGCWAGAADPPGKCAEWARELHRRAVDLLAMFETEDPSADRATSARKLLQDLPINAMEDAGLPLVGAQAIEEAMRAIGTLARRAGIAAGWFEAQKGTRARQPRLLEVDLFASLRAVFREAFGREWAPVTDPNTGKRGGPGLRFGTAVIRMMSERLAGDDFLQATLRRLAEPETVTERIRGSRLSGGPVRKREAKRHRDRRQVAT